jgi:hypothetical protein
MKTRILVILIIAHITLVCCKNKSSDKTLEEPVIVNNSNNTYSVVLDVIVKKDDDFQIYYTDKTSADFNEKESVWVNVKGSESPQKVVFTFPENTLPTLFRLDFGLNNEQESIVLTSVEVNCFGNIFKTSGKEMSIYFRAIEDTEIDFEKGIIKPIVKDGKGIEPVLYPQEVPLEIELKKLIINYI